MSKGFIEEFLIIIAVLAVILLMVGYFAVANPKLFPCKEDALITVCQEGEKK